MHSLPTCKHSPSTAEWQAAGKGVQLFLRDNPRFCPCEQPSVWLFPLPLDSILQRTTQLGAQRQSQQPGRNFTVKPALFILSATLSESSWVADVSSMVSFFEGDETVTFRAGCSSAFLPTGEIQVGRMRAHSRN